MYSRLNDRVSLTFMVRVDLSQRYNNNKRPLEKQWYKIKTEKILSIKKLHFVQRKYVPRQQSNSNLGEKCPAKRETDSYTGRYYLNSKVQR